VCCVVVAAVEDAHSLGVGGGKGFEELDEALLIVDLEVLGLRMGRMRVRLTFSSGRFDMIAVFASWIGSVYLLSHMSISSLDFEMVVGFGACLLLEVWIFGWIWR